MSQKNKTNKTDKSIKEYTTITVKDIESILRLLNAIEPYYNDAMAEQTYTEQKTQDLLHELELLDLSHNKRGWVATELAVMRRRRRCAKNTIEVIGPMVDWLYRNGKAISDLKSVLGKMRQTEEKQASRVYYKRADGKNEMIPHNTVTARIAVKQDKTDDAKPLGRRIN
jgi:stage III sporulation protein SpoIIIAA